MEHGAQGPFGPEIPQPEMHGGLAAGVIDLLHAPHRSTRGPLRQRSNEQALNIERIAVFTHVGIFGGRLHARIAHAQFTDDERGVESVFAKQVDPVAHLRARHGHILHRHVEMAGIERGEFTVGRVGHTLAEPGETVAVIASHDVDVNVPGGALGEHEFVQPVKGLE